MKIRKMKSKLFLFAFLASGFVIAQTQGEVKYITKIKECAVITLYLYH